MRNRRRAAARHRWWGNLAAGMIGFGLALVLAEGAARVAYPGWTDFNRQRFIDVTTVDGTALTLGRAGFEGWFAQNNGDFRVPIRLNAAGLRNDDPVEAATGRLWAVGESFTFGWGVIREDSFGAVAASRLGWNWYNVASPSATLEETRRLMLRMPAAVRPRAVVLGLPLGDELGRNPAEAPAAVGLHASWLQLKHRLGERSAFYNLVVQALKRSDRVNTLLVGLQLVEPPRERHPPLPDSEIDAALDSSLEAIGRVQALVPAEVPFVVLLIPTRDDLLNSDPFYRRQRLGMIERLTAHGILVVDPSDAFLSAEKEQVYFAHDDHWTPLGHRLAGEAVARALAPLPSAPTSPAAP